MASENFTLLSAVEKIAGNLGSGQINDRALTVPDDFQYNSPTNLREIMLPDDSDPSDNINSTLMYPEEGVIPDDSDPGDDTISTLMYPEEGVIPDDFDPGDTNEVSLGSSPREETFGEDNPDLDQVSEYLDNIGMDVEPLDAWQFIYDLKDMDNNNVDSNTDWDGLAAKNANSVFQPYGDLTAGQMEKLAEEYNQYSVEQNQDIEKSADQGPGADNKHGQQAEEKLEKDIQQQPNVTSPGLDL